MGKKKNLKKSNIKKYITDDDTQKNKSKKILKDEFSDEDKENDKKKKKELKEEKETKKSKKKTTTKETEKSKKEKEENEDKEEKEDLLDKPFKELSFKNKILYSLKWGKNTLFKIFNFTAKKTFLEFWIGLLMLILCCFLLTFFTGNDLTVAGIVVGLFVIGFTSLLAGRFKDVGLKWYVPVIGVAVIIISLIIGSLGGTFISSNYSLNYLSLLILFATTGQISIDSFIPLIVLLVLGFGLVLLDILFILVIVCKKANSFPKKKSKTQRLFIINYVLAGLLLASSTILLSKMAEEKYSEVENILKVQMYGIDNNGNEKEGITALGFLNQELTGYEYNTVIDQFNKSNEVLKEVAEVEKSCTNINDNIKIYGIWGQQCNKNGQSINLIELVFYNPTDEDQQIIISSGEYNETTKEDYNLTATIPSHSYTSIPIETNASLSDGVSISYNIIVNGEKYKINTRLYAITTTQTTTSTNTNTLVD